MNPSIPNQYDPANAAGLAAIAAASYQPQTEIPGWKTTVVAAEATDSLALVASNGEDCVVAFRGTQDLRNWLTDLDCDFTPLGTVRVHRGFHQALDSIRHDLESALEATPRQRLWLTGHSLGGALAMLCASGWGRAVHGVYTFGQPRVGDAAFRDDYNRRLGALTFRVIHSDDVVPRVPWLLGAYRHAGHEAFYPTWPRRPVFADGGEESAPPWPYLDLPWPAKLTLDVPSLLTELRRGQLALLNDHHISRYSALFPGWSRAASNTPFLVHP
jgi:triacylglycerol lipase